MSEVIYLNEVKLRNQLRKDLQGLGLPVAKKSEYYRSGYVHVDSIVSSAVRDEDGWFKITYTGYSNNENTLTKKLLLAQTLQLAGYEIERLTKTSEMFGQEVIWLYRKAAK